MGTGAGACLARREPEGVDVHGGGGRVIVPGVRVATIAGIQRTRMS